MTPEEAVPEAPAPVEPVSEPGLAPVIPTDRLDLVVLDHGTLMEAAGGGDPFTTRLGWANPDQLLVEEEQPVSALLAGWLLDDPEHPTWMGRVMVDRRISTMVGHIGFHRSPDAGGTVEIGYTVAPSRRREGLAVEAVLGLARAAATHRSVVTVRAVVLATNVASAGLVQGLGFEVVGERSDAEGNAELIWEAAVGHIGR